MPRSLRITGLLLIALVSTAAILIAQDAPPATPATPNVGADMKAMNTALKQLKTQIADSTKNEASLALVAKLQTASLEAKAAIPGTMTRFPEADRPEKLKGYRTTMLKLIRTELDLEEQLIAGDNTKAAATLASLEAIEREGHTEYRPRRQN